MNLGYFGLYQVGLQHRLRVHDSNTMKIIIWVVTYRSSCPSPDLPGEGGACESTLTLSMYGSYLWHPGTVVPRYFSAIPGS